jgi:hypothetical protein
MGETYNAGGGTTDIIAYYSGLPLPVIIPSLFLTASSVIRSVDSGPNKVPKAYVTLKSNYNVTYTTDLTIRGLLTVTLVTCIKYEDV